MACFAQLLFFSVLITFIAISDAQEGPFLPDSVVLPVRKDVSTNQYVAKIFMGNEELVPTKLVVDLAGSFSWMSSSTSSSPSPKKPFSCCSLQCSMAKSSSCADNESCTLQAENPITKMVKFGELTEDMVSVHVNDGIKIGSLALIPHFLMSSAPALLLRGLGNGVKGMLGLGNSRISLPSQVAETFGFQRKFSMCLSSSNGVVVIGESTYLSPPNSDVAKSLMYTPLVVSESKKPNGYHFQVKSIRINGKKLAIKEDLLVRATQISTTVPYSTMESTLYSAFTEAYVSSAIAMNMNMVSPVAPFEFCFGSEWLETKRVGPNVPVVDLVLQSEMVKWRIHGRDSMVFVSDKVMCLGFLDGGLNPKASIVLGGYQLEDKLLEFNLATSMLGFSSSSLSNVENRSCSDFNVLKIPQKANS
ncbi:OLC1v1020177C1 [Oldenlandia corymbosa var. corymbosa]|uniref:OLC1v1020177C1 n=1 Tax=Oldenlandia corymbosa var. corymbosa TaxID=529605 RepID=A0AAV1EFS6_OLDCO|nr:OLC1v1020177C1 [Oldenlandia corymbosa var. corymbosa]